MNMKDRRAIWVAGMLLASATAWADTYTWDATKNVGTTYNWQDAANWNEGGFPSQAGDVATIAAAFPTGWNKTIISLEEGTVTVGTMIRRLGGSLEISNGTLIFSTLTGDALLDSSAVLYDEITANVTFNTHTTIRNHTHAWGSTTYPLGLKIKGVVSSSGAYGLYKDGPGMLVLDNDLNSFSGPITVANGVLHARHTGATPGWGVLGHADNSITLGSVGARGGLVGHQSSTALTRPIRLEGVGGMLIPPIPNVINNVISGPGELLIAYTDNLFFRNTVDNTYSGGTRVHNRYTYAYSDARVFGTGDVTIEYSGRLHLLNPTNNVNPAAKVLISSLEPGSAIGPNLVGGILILGGDSVPEIDARSSGVIGLGGPFYNEPRGPGAENFESGPNINARFAVGAPQLGNGYMHYGAWDRTSLAPHYNNIFTGSSLQPSLDGMYRFTCGGTSIILDAPGVLTDANGVEVFGIPGVGHRGPDLRAANTFSGLLRVNYNSTFTGNAFSGDASAFGAIAGPVELRGGGLVVNRGSNADSTAQKGTLTFESSSVIRMRNNHATHSTTLILDELVRTNRGVLAIGKQWDILGTRNRITVGSPPPVTHGMVPPYIVAAWGYNDVTAPTFMNYVEDVGFTNAVFTHGTLLNAQSTDIVEVTAPESVPAGGVELHALRTFKSNLSNNGNNDDTIKIGSGGLILHGSSTHTAPIDFGESEGVVFLAGTVADGFVFELNGTLSGANGLTFAGDLLNNIMPAQITIGADNSSSLTGTVTINRGVVNISSSANLGPDSNLIVINSGAYSYNDRMGGLGPAAFRGSTCDQDIWLGPAGGSIYTPNNNWWMKLGGQISGPGFLAVSKTVCFVTNTLNTYTGGTIVNVGGSLYVGHDMTAVTGVGKLGPGPIMVGALGSDGTLYLCGTDNVDPDTRVLVMRFVGPGSRLELRGSTTRIGSLEGDGQVYLSYNTASPACKLFVGGNDLSTEFSGIIYDRNGTGQLVKEGTGVLTLSGYNTFGGATTVEEGTLRVNATLSGPAAVNNGATLGGRGVIANQVTLTGGTLAPGADDQGVLTVTGDVTFDADSTYQVTLSGTEPAVDYGQLSVQGTLDLNGAALSVALTRVPVVGEQFTITDNPAGATIGATRFESDRTVVSELFNGRTYTFIVDYAGGVNGKDIVLSFPATGSLILVR